MDVIFKILLVVVGLGFIIFVHELGHFLVAKWCGVRAHSFSFGMGPVLIGVTPKYPWKPGHEKFRYNDVLGPDALEDANRDLLEYFLSGEREPARHKAAMQRLPRTSAGRRRLRLLSWPVAKLQPMMVLAHIEKDGDHVTVRPEQIDQAKIDELKGSGTANVLVFDAGETEYRLSLLPLGGYVGMAGGEVPGEGDGMNLPDEFLQKGPGKRAAILSAGVIMNAVSAFLMFIAAYAIGVETPPAVIGGTAPAVVGAAKEGDKTIADANFPGPSWVAGLEAGDEIVDIKVYPEGETPPADDGTVNTDLDFTELRIAVAFTDPHQIVRIFYLRNGTRGFVDVKPVYNPSRGFMIIGVQQVLTPRVDAVDPSAAERLEGKLQRGDMVVAVNGADLAYSFPLPEGQTEDLGKPWPRSYEQFKTLMRQTEGDTVNLTILRNGQRQDVEIPVTRAPSTVSLGLGMTPVVPARAVRKGGPADSGVLATTNDAGQIVPGEEPFSLRSGDRVVQVGDRTARSFEDVRNWIDQLPADEFSLFTVERKKEDGGVERLQVFMAPHEEPLSGRKVLEFLPDMREYDSTGPGSRKILQVDPDGPAANAKFIQAGTVPDGITLEKKLLPGDVILKVNDNPVASWNGVGDTSNPGVMEILAASWDRKSRTAPAMRLQVVRTLTPPGAEGESEAVNAKPIEATLTFEVVPAAPEGEDNVLVGFIPSQAKVTVQHGAGKAIEMGLMKTWTMTQQVFLTIRSLFKGTVDAKNIGGPVMIATVSYKFAGWGLGTFIYFMAIISVNLAIINLLPIPLLDGGHLVFTGIEAARGKPVSERIQGYATWVGLLMILALIVFVMYNDIARLVNG